MKRNTKNKGVVKNSRNYTAPALEKGLEVLELLAAEQKPMTLAQISGQLGRSKSELYRMLAVLEQKNYLARGEDKDFFNITNKLFNLGMSVPPVGTLVESAFPVMHQLAEATQQPCHLAVASDYRMVVIARVESPSRLGLSVRVGHSLYLFESCSGRTLLAWMPVDQREGAYKYFAKHCKNFRKPPESEAKSIQQRRFLRMTSMITEGVEDMSSPVFDGKRRAIAALTIPFLKHRNSEIGPDKTLKHLVEAASRLSALAPAYEGL
ncbi:MAG TPA: IclR family transcriptional regulator [Gammaproteobacteria bacterium]|nr:IclR family transcriptional regulator [Gammaproteobacteria bacterium]